ncbi:ankyrin repeat-containing domain protein [Astrocystis sublimbata]|nr:ankyrin repeat-containing domain protein [Astrocystis sublimbata]
MDNAIPATDMHSWLPCASSPASYDLTMPLRDEASKAGGAMQGSPAGGSDWSIGAAEFVGGLLHERTSGWGASLGLSPLRESSLAPSISQDGQYGKKSSLHQESLLHLAVRNGNCAIIQSLLKHRRMDVNERDSAGKTALHKAVATGNAAVVTCLLANGADADAGDLEDKSPLYVAVSHDLSHIVDLLLSAAASNASKRY